MSSSIAPAPVQTEQTKSVLFLHFSVLCPMACKVNNRAWINTICHLLTQRSTLASVLSSSKPTTLSSFAQSTYQDLPSLCCIPTLAQTQAKTFAERICEVLACLDVTPFCDDEALTFYLDYILQIGLEWFGDDNSTYYTLLTTELSTWQTSNMLSNLITAKDSHYEALISLCKRTRFYGTALKAAIFKMQSKGWRIGVFIHLSIYIVYKYILSSLSSFYQSNLLFFLCLFYLS